MYDVPYAQKVVPTPAPEVVGRVQVAPSMASAAPGSPAAAPEKVASGLREAWSVGFLPDGTAVFAEKDSKKVREIDGAEKVPSTS
ncbi:hypothetical protein [Amycolatopsis minnesotensis]|uniref:Uncharacterized protein n=1 Tax=Amycolatopsis minnesotensis TaxID=337894 RepID=A0ABN2R0A5_9PSEU